MKKTQKNCFVWTSDSSMMIQASPSSRLIFRWTLLTQSWIFTITEQFLSFSIHMEAIHRLLRSVSVAIIIRSGKTSWNPSSIKCTFSTLFKPPVIRILSLSSTISGHAEDLGVQFDSSTYDSVLFIRFVLNVFSQSVEMVLSTSFWMEFCPAKMLGTFSSSQPLAWFPREVRTP